MTYTIIRLPLKQYLKYRIKRHGGIKPLLKLTDSKYPKIIALGVCYHSTKEIIIAKVGKWELRLKHENGHTVGLQHTMKLWHVMHPWGFLRGNKYE